MQVISPKLLFLMYSHEEINITQPINNGIINAPINPTVNQTEPVKLNPDIASNENKLSYINNQIITTAIVAIFL